MSETRFIFSPEVDYQCILCGDCCREGWRIPLDQAARDSLAARDWTGTPLEALAKEKPDFFSQDAPSVPTKAVFKTRHGGCVLLDEQGRCTAHVHFGRMAKGVVCRLFPYLFVEAPEGVYAGYSFCCRPVRSPGEAADSGGEQPGEPVQEILQEARAFFPGIHYHKAPAQVEITPGFSVSWEDYLRLEQCLLELLSREDQPLSLRLVEGHVFLNLLAMFLKESALGKELDAGKQTEHYIESMRGKNYDRIERIARRSKGRLFLRRYVLSVMQGIHQQGKVARQRREENGGPAMISRPGLMAAIIRGMLRPYPRARIPREVLDAAAGRYLRHVIWRKGLALGRGLYRLGGLSREYSMLLIEAALLEYEARRLAADMEPEQAVAEAIRRIERDFVLHAGRDEAGPAEEDRDVYELFLGLFDSMVSSKAFAPSMTGR
jgi:hypothetical protein